MKKQQFINLVNALVAEIQYRRELAKLDVELAESSTFTAIEEYLASEINLHPVDGYGDDLDYFLYELDCGKKWKSGTITIDGKDIKLRNAEDLWEMINQTEEDRYEIQ